MQTGLVRRHVMKLFPTSAPPSHNGLGISEENVGLTPVQYTSK